MHEVSHLVGIKQLFTAPYNPKCNGLCERINGVLKSMLKKMCVEQPQEWDRYLLAVLFAYDEVPQGTVQGSHLLKCSMAEWSEDLCRY